MPGTITLPSPARVQVYRPGLSVKLIKLVRRRDGDAERYTEAAREIDLTPYLGDGSTVRTVKDLRDPVGAFTVTFADQPHPSMKDSLAALIEPMDLIEIRAARSPERFPARLPLIMRGFVYEVRRKESMGGDGEPERTVVIQGQDSGVLWTIHQIVVQLANLEQPLLTAYGLQTALGMDVRPMTASEFMRQLVERGINEKVRDLAAFSGVAGLRNVRPFTVEASVEQGMVIPAMAGALRAGPLWNVVEEFTDRPWNEAFIEDREDGPVFIFRPAPFKDLQGRMILAGAQDPGTIVIDAGAVVSIDVSRSHRRVANVFWVPPGVSMLATNNMLSPASFSAGRPLDFGHPNNRPALYGARMMQAATRLAPTDVQQPVNQLPPDQQEAATGSWVAWHEARMDQLKSMNRDNAVLEDGSMTVRGHEEFAPGKYLRLDRGRMRSEFYVTQVQHNIVPLGSWTSNLTVERGCGFYERNRAPGSPYFAEGFDGPYDN